MRQVPAVAGIVSLDEEGHTWVGMAGSKLTWAGWLTCCKLCNLYPTPVSLIPLYLFLYIVILFFAVGL